MIKLRIFPTWHWGHSYIATFSDEQQTLDFCRRKESTCAIQEIEDAPINFDQFPALGNYLYPRCEHGLSDWLCNGPSHYPPDHLMPDYIV